MFCSMPCMTKSLNHPLFMKALNWAYEKSMNGVPGLDSADELAQKYMVHKGTLHEKADLLIRRQNINAGASGFISGLGGLLTLPVAIPANLASVLYIQIRMIAAIAHMGGHNLRDEKVKTLVYICLVGNFAKDFIQEAGIMLGTKLTARAVENISEKSLIAINRRVGFRLITTYSEKGLVHLAKAIPLVGGIIGGTIDTVTTNIIGNAARKAFLTSGI